MRKMCVMARDVRMGDHLPDRAVIVLAVTQAYHKVHIVTGTGKVITIGDDTWIHVWRSENG